MFLSFSYFCCLVLCHGYGLSFPIMSSFQEKGVCHERLHEDVYVLYCISGYGVF